MMEQPDLSRFSEAQKTEVQLGIEKKLEVEIYAHEIYPALCMREVRKGLEDGIDMGEFLRKGYSAGILRQIRKAYVKHVDISSVLEKGFDASQLREIRKALENHVDISDYLLEKFSGSQLHEIRKGIEADVDVSVYAHANLNWMQMQELRLGLMSHVDVSVYNDIYFSASQMRQIRLGLEEGLDVTAFAQHIYSKTDMESRRVWEQDHQLSMHIPDVVPEADASVVNELDEQLEIVILPDLMKASATFKNDIFDHLTKMDIISYLKEHGVILGLSEENIEKMIAEKIVGTPVDIAFGRMATDGKDGYYEYFFDTERSMKPKILEDGSLDYSNVQPYEVVEKGQVVAVYHAPENGIFGFFVNGQMSVPSLPKGLPKLAGTGFSLRKDGKTYVSETAGCINLQNQILKIDPLFRCEGNYTAIMGMLKYDGDILITGDVLGAADIEATGDITIEGSVEAAKIHCGGNLMIKKGISASGAGMINVKGNLQARFLEKCNVFVEKNIYANYIMQSDVECFGEIELFGKRSSIKGGTVSAVQRIKTATLGNEMNIITKINLGLIDRYQKTVKQKQTEINKLVYKINDLKKDLNRAARSGNNDLKKTSILSAIAKLLQQKEELQKELEKTEAESTKFIGLNQLYISGDAYPGCVVTINQTRYMVRSHLVHSALRLTGGNITTNIF